VERALEDYLGAGDHVDASARATALRGHPLLAARPPGGSGDAPVRVARVDAELGLRLRMQARFGAIEEPLIRVFADAPPMGAVDPELLRELLEENLEPGQQLIEADILQYDEEGRTRRARMLRIVVGAPGDAWEQALQMAWLREDECGTPRAVGVAVLDVASTRARSLADVLALTQYLASAPCATRCEALQARARNLIQGAHTREAGLRRGNS
jgi:hypothetical protein